MGLVCGRLVLRRRGSSSASHRTHWEYKTPPNVDAAWNAYRSRPAVELNRAIIDATTEAQTCNETILREKRRYLRAALVALAVETLILASIAVS